MSFADLGTADRDVNVETNSNHSDDILSTDDEDVNTYADILRRTNSPTRPVSRAGSYLGRGRLVTEFEHTHFTADNITPGRPCTAYFSPGYFIDSKDVFDKLEELGIPRDSVVCLQRRPSRDVLITFIDEETKNKFVSCVAVRFRDSSAAINDEDMPLTFLNVYDAPHELSDEALNLRLSKYCTVFSVRRGKFSNSHIYNGLRHYRVRVKEPLPSYLRFGKFLVRLSHDGQQHTCRRCNRAGHFANECQNIVCFNCEELGHQSRECEENVRCCICKSIEHVARHCPYSWYQASSTSQASISSPRRAREPGRSVGDIAESAVEQAVENAAERVFGNVEDAEIVNAATEPGDSLNTPGGDVPRDDVPREYDSPKSPTTNSDVLLAQLVSSPPSSVQPSGESSASRVLDSQGFVCSSSTPSQDAGSQLTSQSTSDDQPSGSLSSDVPLNDDLPDAQPLASSSRRARIRPSVASSRRKPAPLPPALEALTRRPTRPALPVSKKPGAVDPPPPPPGADDDPDCDEMDTSFSLKRKQEQKRKKIAPKKGKH